MKHDLTTGTWQDDTGCPISIILATTSDGFDFVALRACFLVVVSIALRFCWSSGGPWAGGM